MQNVKMLQRIKNCSYQNTRKEGEKEASGGGWGESLTNYVD